MDVPPARSELKPPKPPPTLVGHDERVFMVWTYTTKVSLDPEHPIQESPDYGSKPLKSFWWNTVTNATTALREPPPRDHGPGEKDKKTEKPTPEMWTPHISDGAPPPADEAPELVGTFFARGHANDCAKCQHDILGVGCFEEDDERNFLSRSQRLDELHVYHEDDDVDDDGKDEDGLVCALRAHRGNRSPSEGLEGDEDTTVVAKKRRENGGKRFRQTRQEMEHKVHEGG